MVREWIARWGERRRGGAAKRRAVEELGRALALLVDPEGIQAAVAARLCEVFGAGRVLILRADPRRRALVPALSGHGLSGPALNGLGLDLQGRLVRWLRTNEAPLAVRADRGTVAWFDPAEQDILRRLDVEVCVPMISLNRLTGVLLLAAGEHPWRPGREDLALLQVLAGQAALALDNAETYRRERERLGRLHRAERLALAGQLAAGVAHEIRNPLAAIRSTVPYLVRRLPEGDPGHEHADGLIAEVDRVNRTIKSLLGLAQPPTEELAETDLGAALEQALRLVAAKAAEQGVALCRDTAEGVEEVSPVLGDARQLAQLFLNLLLNALQALPEGGTIRTAVRPWSKALDDGDGRDWVEAEVRDDGAGISEEHLARVFEPFFTTRAEGTGLGLAICRGIAERHGGEIAVDSAPGRGTAVAVRLPGVARRG
jgi:signal transduction histidine kinase